MLAVPTPPTIIADVSLGPELLARIRREGYAIYFNGQRFDVIVPQPTRKLDPDSPRK